MFVMYRWIFAIEYDPNYQKTNIVDIALGIDNQYKHAAQPYPDRQISPPVFFLFQEQLLYTYIPMCRPGLAYITQSP